MRENSKPKDDELKTTKLILLFSIFCLLVGVHSFFVAFHNIDICQNDLRLQEVVHQKTGILVELKEMDINLNERVLMECYLSGLKWSVYSMYFIIGASIFLGYSLSRIKE